MAIDVVDNDALGAYSTCVKDLEFNVKQEKSWAVGHGGTDKKVEGYDRTIVYISTGMRWKCKQDSPRVAADYYLPRYNSDSTNTAVLL